MQMKGLYTAMITPFNKNGDLDEEGLRLNIRFQIENGVSGIVLLGTTGETPTLTMEEQERIVQIGVEECKNRIQIIVGTGSYSTKETIKKTKMAQSLGADAALVVTPYYNKPTQEGIYLHYKALSEETSLPICLYNIQGRTGQNIQVETLKKIGALPNILGIKESSGNLSQVDDVIQCFQDKKNFSILSGDDNWILPIMALGGHGIISVASNIIPSKVRQLVDACSAGNFQLGRTIHQELSSFFKGLFVETNPIPVKAIMRKMNKPAGFCRLPLCDLNAENQNKIDELIATLPTDWFN